MMDMSTLSRSLTINTMIGTAGRKYIHLVASLPEIFLVNYFDLSLQNSLMLKVVLAIKQSAKPLKRNLINEGCTLCHTK